LFRARGHRHAPAGDRPVQSQLTCTACREAVSARLDGEEPGVPTAAVQAHLTSCAGCRGYEQAACQLLAVREQSAGYAPDLTGAILASIGATTQAASTQGDSRPGGARSLELRIALAVVAVLQLLLGLPALVWGSDAGAPIHAARELGSFSAALAVGLLVCAWQPRRIAGMLPVAGALGALLAVTAILDLTSGRTLAIGEISHLLEMGGVVLLILLGRANPTTHVGPGRATTVVDQ
jgi:predicted anti-sigma-YlaC factor YlaD